MKNLYQGWITTIIGLITFACSLTYVFVSETPDYIIFSILLVAGISFLFFPDTVITNLKTYLQNKAEAKPQDPTI